MTARRRPPTSPLLAGWLFADLLLGVTIVMLGAQAPPPSPTGPQADIAQPLPRTVQTMPAITHPLPQATRSSPEKKPAAPKKGHPEKETGERGSGKSGKDDSRGEGPTSARPSPSAAPSPCVMADVQAKPITISFRTAPGVGDAALSAQVRQELLKHRDRLAGKHAGMVLTFGADGGSGTGVLLATRVNTAIRQAYPRIFGTAVTRNFHDLDAPSGSISMEIYLMTYGCSPGSGSSGPLDG
ncbi:hypothetical protein GCM10017673_21230 [Streptosporangium violaceochromogenes]|nr:hypothetical protein GCM10017673_21230 [Streptosporangium violaceochromogenes]